MLRLYRLTTVILRSDTGNNGMLMPHIKAISNVRTFRSSSVHFSEEYKGHEIIYNGPLSTQIRAVKFFSVSSSIFGLIAQPIIVNEASRIGSTSLLVAMCSVVGFFTFVTPVLLHFLTKKYVTALEYDPTTATFTATTVTFFCTEKELTFKPEDVVVPDVPGMFTTFLAKGYPLYVEAQHFSDVRYYAKIMGYDKPMDFKLGEQDLNEKLK